MRQTADATDNTTVIVSGLPRSGTSMLMKMLDAAGLDIVTDNIREADRDNPRGYYEYEPVKDLARDNSWVPQFQGKTLKVISHLLYYLPPELSYKIIFIRRDIKEVLASQRKMYERLQGEADNASDALLADKYVKHLYKINSWLRTQAHVECLFVRYGDMIGNPLEQAQRISDFL